MLKLFKTIFQVGDATVKYPFQPLEVCPGFRGKPELQPEQCIACAACTMVCPANALTMETCADSGERIWQLYLGRCIYCGRCEEVCPTRAITLSGQFELAVSYKEDLYTRAHFYLQRCEQCQKPFSTQKSVQFAMDMLAQSGLPEQAVEGMRSQFSTCPACKRKRDLSHSDQRTVNYQLKGTGG
ncbi:MAG: hydrogenase 4 subunit H [Enterobacteriaceae bacterium]